MLNDTIPANVVLKLLQLQKRCIECGETFKIEVHHRVFRSEGDKGLKKHLLEMSKIYLASYNRELAIWTSIHDIQNLCVLCSNCHSELHRGNEKLRQKIRNSFTCKVTGFSVSFYKSKTLY